MDLSNARDVLRGAVNYPIVQADMDEATLVVLAALDRLELIERRAQQIRGGLKPYARPAEVVDFLLSGVDGA